MASIAELSRLLDEKLAPIIHRLDGVERRLDGVERRLDGVERRLDGMERRLDGLERRLDGVEARQMNAGKGREGRLEKVPFPDGTLPGDAEYPLSLSHMLVAGNESLPNGQPNTWNAKMSKALLRKYRPASTATSDSEGEDEHSHRSRNRRLELARTLGITAAQLNFAQLTL